MPANNKVNYDYVEESEDFEEDQDQGCLKRFCWLWVAVAAVVVVGVAVLIIVLTCCNKGHCEELYDEWQKLGGKVANKNDAIASCKEQEKKNKDIKKILDEVRRLAKENKKEDALAMAGELFGNDTKPKKETKTNSDDTKPKKETTQKEQEPKEQPKKDWAGQLDDMQDSPDKEKWRVLSQEIMSGLREQTKNTLATPRQQTKTCDTLARSARLKLAAHRSTAQPTSESDRTTYDTKLKQLETVDAQLHKKATGWRAHRQASKRICRNNETQIGAETANITPLIDQYISEYKDEKEAEKAYKQAEEELEKKKQEVSAAKAERHRLRMEKQERGMEYSMWREAVIQSHILAGGVATLPAGFPGLPLPQYANCLKTPPNLSNHVSWTIDETITGAGARCDKKKWKTNGAIVQDWAKYFNPDGKHFKSWGALASQHAQIRSHVQDLWDRYLKAKGIPGTATSVPPPTGLRKADVDLQEAEGKPGVPFGSPSRGEHDADAAETAAAIDKKLAADELEKVAKRVRSAFNRVKTMLADSKENYLVDNRTIRITTVKPTNDSECAEPPSEQTLPATVPTVSDE